MKNTDLHTHSYYSDGMISPGELVRLAKRKGIKNLALTDHDSIGGVKEAINKGKRLGVKVIPAVEIGSRQGEVLGYFIDINNPQLIKGIKSNRRESLKCIKDYCKQLKKEGYGISFMDLKRKFPKSENLTIMHSLYFLELKGYKKSFGIKSVVRKKVKPRKARLMGIKQAIKLIINSKGVPVLAHPWLADPRVLSQIKNLKKAGLKGIEVNNGDRYPFMPKGMAKKIRKIAKKYDLILISGSDYHGEGVIRYMPGNHALGKNNCDECVVDKLKILSKKIKP